MLRLHEFYARAAAFAFGDPELRRLINAVQRGGINEAHVELAAKFLSGDLVKYYKEHDVGLLVDYLIKYKDKYEALSDRRKMQLREAIADPKTLPPAEHSCMNVAKAGITYESLHHWLYSFWNRRKLEGSSESAFALLLFIKSLYD